MLWLLLFPGFAIMNERAGVYFGVKTCLVFLCFVAIVRVRVYYVDFFVFLFHVTGEC